MKKIILISLVLISTSILAGNSGTTGFSFLKIGVSAAGSAMGDAYSNLALDASAMYWNPALLAKTKSNSLHFMHNRWFADISHSFAAAQLLRGKHNLAFSVNFVNIPGIEIRGEAPTLQPDSRSTAQNFTAGVGYAQKPAENISLGIHLKYLYEKYYLAEASGAAIDVGVFYENLWQETDLSVIMQNLGWMNKLDQSSTKLPFLLKAGLSSLLPRVSENFSTNFAIEAVHVFDDVSTINTGLEFTVIEKFALRGGYVLGSESRTYSAGFGLKLNTIDVAYAYVPYKYDLGQSHRFSLVYFFE